jgi:hypothetical protein
MPMSHSHSIEADRNLVKRHPVLRYFQRGLVRPNIAYTFHISFVSFPTALRVGLDSRLQIPDP